MVLLKGMRSKAIRLETECITDTALNSVMAEYHRELFRNYHLFAIDCSYGTESCSITNTENHVMDYFTENTCIKPEESGPLSKYFYRDFLRLWPSKVKIDQLALLTDRKGEVFRHLAVSSYKDEVGIGGISALQEWVKTVETCKLEDRDITEEWDAVSDELDSYDGTKVKLWETKKEIKWETVHIEDPTAEIRKKREGLLGRLLTKKGDISAKAIDTDALISNRIREGKANEGNLDYGSSEAKEGLAERFIFQEYLLQHMSSYLAPKEDRPLIYQMEYLIAGQGWDSQNLESVLARILAIREAANAMYLFTDEKKCSEAEAVAALLSAVILLPELTEGFKVLILFGWSCAESIYDMEELLNGKKVPLMKDEKTWHYSFWGAWDGFLDKSKEKEETGLSYEDYLRIFMMLTDPDTLTGRAMDMVECHIRQTPGNKSFRLDGCVVAMEAEIQVGSDYGYHYVIKRKKKYER